MKISSADIQLASQHTQSREHRLEERFTAAETPVAPSPAPDASENNTPRESRLRVQVTPLPKAEDKIQLYAPTTASRMPGAQNAESISAAPIDFFTLLVESFIGKKIELRPLNPSEPASLALSVEFTLYAAEIELPPEPTQAIQLFDYYRHELIIESETSSFSAKGSITLEDGSELTVDLQHSMHYQYRFEEEINLSNQRLVDPLIINTGNTAASLTEQAYSFDLNADGNDENIHFASASSAFLALDKNSDGQINNGSELFGAITGDGFAELAIYDEDGNGFIDEGDSIFQQLRLYNKSDEGEDQLSTLQDAGIGAIYLSSTSTPFSIKNDKNELLAAVRASSFYISEDGSSGTVQQIDLAV